jgi:hypothetical protein
MTGLESRSLGGAEYRRLLSAVGLYITREYEDEGQNHYFDAHRQEVRSRFFHPASASTNAQQQAK